MSSDLDGGLTEPADEDVRGRALDTLQTSSSHVDVVDSTLDELVHQFSDPLSFLRELVQNALDAGSHEVDVRTRFDPPTEEGAQGVAVLSVADFGHGMTREIIERRLTRLFSSDKDGDRTKIGKFGIGFVSVFAIRPDAVIVDTGRDGEYWRVLFRSDRSFELRRLDRPIEGTEVRILKSSNQADYEALRARAREVLRFWCRHATQEIRFDGIDITEPFGLDAVVEVHHDDGLSALVVGHASTPTTFGGYYNGGLTLFETNETRFPGLMYKVSSTQLEHTLTRDAVMRDAGYRRLSKLLDALVHRSLFEETFIRLENALDRDGASDGLFRAAAWHLQHAPNLRIVRKRRCVKTLGGRVLTVRELVRALGGEDAVLWAGARDALTDALEREGTIVLADGPSGRELAQAHRGEEIGNAHERFGLAERDEDPSWSPLCRATRRLLEAAGMKIATVYPARFHGGGPKPPTVWAVDNPSEPEPTSDLGRLGERFFHRRRHLAIEVDEPVNERLRVLALREPELGATILVKTFFVGERLDAELDGRLARLALEQRWTRPRG